MILLLVAFVLVPEFLELLDNLIIFADLDRWQTTWDRAGERSRELSLKLQFP